MSCSERRLHRLFRHCAIVILAALATEIRANGAEPGRLTTDGTLKLAPVFINNGDEVVFATHEIPNLVSIVGLRLSDHSRRRLHPTVVNHQFDPAFSRDGRYHAFGRSATSPQMVLVIQDTQEKKDGCLPTAGITRDRANPSFAPDGSRIVFSLSDIGGHQIASVNPRGEDLKYLTKSAGMNAWPAYSPDGRKIAFGSSRSGDFEIYVMNADGSDVVALTRSPGLDARPAWSPDGKRIAFHEQSGWELRDLRHERRWFHPAQRHLRTLPATIIPPGTPTAGGCCLFPIATAALIFILVMAPAA